MTASQYRAAAAMVEQSPAAGAARIAAALWAEAERLDQAADQ